MGASMLFMVLGMASGFGALVASQNGDTSGVVIGAVGAVLGFVFAIVASWVSTS